jgi:hypothetical protein
MKAKNIVLILLAVANGIGCTYFLTGCERLKSLNGPSHGVGTWDGITQHSFVLLSNSKSSTDSPDHLLVHIRLVCPTTAQDGDRENSLNTFRGWLHDNASKDYVGITDKLTLLNFTNVDKVTGELTTINASGLPPGWRVVTGSDHNGLTGCTPYVDFIYEIGLNLTPNGTTYHIEDVDAYLLNQFCHNPKATIGTTANGKACLEGNNIDAAVLNIIQHPM